MIDRGFLSLVEKFLSKGVKTPFLLIDTDKIFEKAKKLKVLMPSFEVYYAVKANDDVRLLEFLVPLVDGFEVASVGELKKVLSLGIKGDKIITSNTIKPVEFIEALSDAEVSYIAVDSVSEINKILKHHKNPKMYLRVFVKSEYSEWGLDTKFGAKENNIKEILVLREARGFSLHGLMFHVGSQTTNPEGYSKGFETAMKHINILNFGDIFNIGGGFPAKHGKEVPPIFMYTSIINNLSERIAMLFRRFVTEPGRYIVAEAGVLVCKITNIVRRNGKTYVYVDTGVFNGLAEAIYGIDYYYYSFENFYSESDAKYIIAGISCDGVDIITKHALLPSSIKEGQHILIFPAGAYTTVYASQFNGFNTPQIILT